MPVSEANAGVHRAHPRVPKDLRPPVRRLRAELRIGHGAGEERRGARGDAKGGGAVLRDAESVSAEKKNCIFLF